MILLSLVILYLVGGWNVNKCIQALCDISANHVSFSRHFCSNPHIRKINDFPKNRSKTFLKKKHWEFWTLGLDRYFQFSIFYYLKCETINPYTTSAKRQGGWV